MAMKVQNRQSRILAEVRSHEKATVEYLADLLGTSRETIRRDLTDLERQGKISKFHGGAMLPRLFGEGALQQRMSENVEAKLRIARTAAALFHAGETLFVDTGSTTQYFAEQMAQVRGVNIITNSTDVARAISAGGQSGAYLLGGQFSSGNRQTVGTMTIEQINGFQAHHAVLTVGALGVDTGVADYNLEESQVAKAMIARAGSVTVLADHSKFGAMASFGVCPLDSINRLVCDTAPPAGLARALGAAGVEVVIAGQAE
jgi:DeoR family glycerol-3-phosphate regulon repressor